MAIKLKLGSTPEELELEREAEEEARIARITENSRKYQEKLHKIIKRRKRDKILVTFTFFLLVFSLVIFGTYNTFFKTGLKSEEVIPIINSSSLSYPVAGLPGYIRKNINNWLDNKINYNKSELQKIDLELDSISIDLVEAISYDLAKVYFSMGITSSKIVEDSNSKDSKNKEKKIEKVEKRYNFYIPISYKQVSNNDGRIIGYSYVPASELTFNYYELYNFSSAIDHQILFIDSELEESSIIESAKIKVDKILSDLYSRKDTSQDFFFVHNFDTQGAKYISLDELMLYKGTNKFGYNSYIRYTVKTEEGFTVQLKLYLALFRNGSSWSINGLN